VDKKKVRTFWSERARSSSSKLPCQETYVTFENDAELISMRAEIETKLVNSELRLTKNDVVVDLGAGNGRYSLFFAPKVQKVVAVEFTDEFASSIRKQAAASHINNIEVLNMSAEDFCRDDSADVVFVSMLLHYLDDEQYRRTVSNISRTLKRGGILFFFETVSLLDDEFFIDKFSEDLNADYTSLYRTAKQYADSFCEKGFALKEVFPVFEDGSVLNKRLETRLYCFIFERE